VSAQLVVEDLRTQMRTKEGTVAPVDGVSLTLDKGRVLGVVGESGSGKTVLTRSIMGLLPKYATVSGSVRFKGNELVGMCRKQLSALWGDDISMVFQDPMTALNPVRRVGDQVAEAVSQHSDLGSRQARAVVNDLLFDVGIPDPKRRADQYPHELSGGMRQRIVIAMALAGRPALLLADEPTTALDVTVQSQILSLLAHQRRLYSTSMILVTHDVGVAAKECDEIAVMYSGRIVEKAPAVTLFSDRVMPYTDALVRSIPTLEDEPHSRLAAIDGRPPSLFDPPTGCRFNPRCPYAQDKCRREEPPLVELNEGHLYRCWYPLLTTQQPWGGADLAAEPAAAVPDAGDTPSTLGTAEQATSAGAAADDAPMAVPASGGLV